MSSASHSDPSIGELFSRATSDMSELLRQELQLAKVEIKQEVRTAGKAGGLLGAGALAGYLALLFVSIAVALVLDEFLGDWLSFLIVGVAYAIAAGALYKRGKDELQHVDPVPKQTVESLKEDVRWAKTQTP